MLLVSFGDQQQTRRWREQTGAAFTLLLDRGRSVYRAFSLERSARRSFAQKTLLYYLLAVLRGEKLHGVQGDPHQMGGDFIVDGGGIVRLAHRSREPADRPSADELLGVLDGLAADDGAPDDAVGV